jgi:hypothetical protein
MIALLLLAAQSPAGAAPGPQPRAVILDGVAFQVGESLVTLSELQRLKDRMMEQKSASSNEEEAQMRAELVRDLLTLRLEEQMGRDMGLDPAQIQRQSRFEMEEEREKVGLLSYVERLSAEGRDVVQEETDRERQLYRDLWQYSKVGFAVAGRRATVDRQVRPGELRILFRENLSALAPIRVQLQILIVASEPAGGAEAARERCADARERTLAGEDLGAIVEEIGAEFRETRGVMQTATASLRDRAVRKFAEEAAVGDLSEVMPVLNARTGRPAPELGYQLVRLLEREETPEPEYEDRDVQKKLREFAIGSQNQAILGRERERLRREAYLWMNPLLGGTTTPGS